MIGPTAKEKVASIERHRVPCPSRYRRSKTRIVARKKQWRDANKDRAYRAAHREELRAKRKDRYAAHREDERAKRRVYWAAHREEGCAKNNAYYATHREEIIKKHREWATRNREWVRAYIRTQRAKHRMECNAKRRAAYLRRLIEEDDSFFEMLASVEKLKKAAGKVSALRRRP